MMQEHTQDARIVDDTRTIRSLFRTKSVASAGLKWGGRVRSVSPTKTASGLDNNLLV